ncbi:MAG: VWA domain-containing protein [Proteobacteria bacterium]|nr:VWA domain-containing protein [Pseudomonadota bacterium]
MKSKETIKSFFKKTSPFIIFLIAISPVLISFLIHISILVYANYVKWSWFDKSPVVQNAIPVEIIDESKKDDKIKFNSKDLKDDFHSDDKMFEPVPEVQYRPVIPVVEILPDSKANEALDIISVSTPGLESIMGGPATGSKLPDTGSAMMVKSFSRHIQSIREDGIDVVFVFDSTDSMSAYLKEVKLKIRNLASAIRKLVPACRIGLVTYRDNKDEYITKQFPLTYSITSLQEFLNKVDYGGGYDIREAVAEGLRVAIEDIKWNKKSRKFILLIGDAPPHIEDMPRAIEMVKNFRIKMGGRLSVIDIREPKDMSRYYWERYIMPEMTDPGIESFEYLTDPRKVMEDFEMLADVGGGESARLTNEKKVIRNMMLMIFGTRWEMYLDEFMKNL